jgi:hypothetical protein
MTEMSKGSQGLHVRLALHDGLPFLLLYGYSSELLLPLSRRLRHPF